MKKILVSILLIFITFNLSACTDYHEIERSSPILSMGIDKEKDKYKISVEILNMNDFAGEISVKPQIISTDGETIDEAIEKIKNMSSEELYFSYLEVIILNEDMAKEGIDDVLDIILRNNEFRLSINLLVTKDDAQKILKSKSNLQPIHGVEIANTLKENENNTSIVVVTPIYKIINMMSLKGVEICLPSVKIQEDKEESAYAIENIAVFEDDKLKGYVDHDISKYYSFATDNAKKSTISVSNDDFLVGGIVDKSKTDIELVDNTLYVNLETSISINEFNSKKDNSFNSKTIKKEFKNKLEKNIKKLITTVQKEYSLDIFGYGLKINKFNQNDFKPYENNWNEHFKNLNVKVNADISLKDDIDYDLEKGDYSYE